MRPADNINELIEKLTLKASAGLDKRINDDISRALAKPKQTKSAGTQPNTWRIAMKSRPAKLAAAAAIIIAVLIGIHQFGGSTPAFAEVIENVVSAKSVSFVMKQKLGIQPAFVCRMYIQGEKIRMDMIGAEGQQEGLEKLRSEMQRRNLTAFMSTIGDFTVKESLELDHFRKTYKKRELDDRVVAHFMKANLIEQFHNVKHEDAEWLREELQDGRKIDVYLAKHVNLMGIEAKLSGKEGEGMTVWVDRRSSLPVRILLKASFHVEGKSEDWLDFSEFAWNEPLDEDLFSLEIPEGYTAVEQSEPNGNM